MNLRLVHRELHDCLDPGALAYACIGLDSFKQWLIQRVVSFSCTLFWRKRDASPPKST